MIFICHWIVENRVVSRELAHLNGVAETISNPKMLINTILLKEAQSSSEIENIITTTDKLYQAFAGEKEPADPAVKEVLSYREALWNGYTQLRERPILSTNVFIEIVQTIKKNTAGIRNVPGTALKNAVSGKTIYTPPEGEELLRGKLKNLEDYIHADDGIDPLVKLAVIHYQFEAIHPFSDGNGRTGRVLNILYLMLQDLLDLPILYLSRYIIENKSQYYTLLNEVTCVQQWEPWVMFMLEAVEETSRGTSDRISAIRNLMDETQERVKNDLPKIYSRELLELLFSQPYCKVQFLVQAGIAKRQTAAAYLRSLTDLGILEEVSLGREKLYLNIKLFDLLRT